VESGVKGRTIEANGLRHHVVVEGEGEAVLLLHGFPDSSALWRHQIPALARAGYRVIAPDLRGFGETDAPAGVEHYAIEHVLADLTGILDVLGVSKAHVCCHDWGALVGWMFATLHPDRTDRFAVLCVGHPNVFFQAGVEQKEKSWYVLLFQLVGLAEEVLRRDDWKLFRAFLRNHPETDAFIRDLSRPGRLTAGLDWYRANAKPEVLFGPPWPLPKVKSPTIAIWATGEHYLVEDQLARSREWVENTWRYELVEGATHFLQLDRPEEVTRLLLDHLRG
jgi:pimeloyl-ACP methyl ester carboxylesterase